MPTFNQLVKQGRTDKTYKSKAPVLQQGFNTQKNHGYYLEHMYSRDYQGIKNHYYLIQIGHMIAQIMEAIEKLWKKVKQSKEQKHQRILESWKTELLSEYMEEMEKPYQIRFI